MVRESAACAVAKCDARFKRAVCEAVNEQKNIPDPVAISAIRQLPIQDLRHNIVECHCLGSLQGLRQGIR